MQRADMSGLIFDAKHESWPLAEPFSISRGTKSNADVIVVTLTCLGMTGRGEAVPYARYGETIKATLEQLDTFAAWLRNQPLQPPNFAGLKSELAERFPAGAARNAIDCALWDLEASLTGTSVARRTALKPADSKVVTAFTLSLAAPDAMAAKARQMSNLPLLKLKLGGLHDEQRMRAVRAARPDARLIADANEAWSEQELPALLQTAAELGFELIEQPLAADNDAQLATIDRPLPVCADESLHTTADLARIAGRYDAVNIKLDKAGGLTEALNLLHAAHAAGLKVMAGSMVATSLAIAPQWFIAAHADWADIDGPLLLAKDRDGGLTITDGVVSPPGPGFWG